MIRAFVHVSGTLRPLSWPTTIDGALWIDLENPTAEELATIGAEIGTRLPSRADMEEIEVSSRIYTDGGTTFLTAVLPAGAEGDAPEMAPVTFALAGERLVTLRYHDPRPFRTYPAHAEHMPSGCASAHAVLFGLLEEIVDRLADLLERAAEEIDGISRAVFSRRAPGAREAQDFRAILERIGAKGDLLSNIRYSLLTLERMLGFLGQLTMERAKGEKMLRAHAKSLARDTRSLVDHAGYLTQKVTFLLDATLGMISTEQNQIIKIFSVMAVAFLPPTLVASIYGMNFEAMPELGWPYGYPLALGAMVLSALLPLWYFRRRGWL